MINVAMVNTEFDRGGAARMAATLNDAINSARKDVSSTFFHAQNVDAAAHVKGLRRPGSRQVNALLARLGGSTWNVDFGLAKELGELCADADLIHLHNLHGYYLDWQKLLRLVKAKPVVWTLHDMWLATGRCGTPIGCDRWVSGCGECPNLKEYPAAWFDRSRVEHQMKSGLLDGSHNIAFVSPSKWLAEQLIRRGCPEQRMFVIPNPVDLSRYHRLPMLQARQTLGLDPSLFTVMFIASDCNDAHKGYEDFLHSIEGLDCQKIVVGTEPREKRADIRYTGQLRAPQALSAHYSACDVMVIPSYFDNYPNTVIESLACGTPVIGYATGGIPSQLEQLEACRVVTTGDVSGLKNAIREQMAQGGKREDVSERLQQKAELRWSARSVAESYIRLYQKHISGQLTGTAEALSV
jgi:glycosyltransferase involved in cell wall biosynthesis